MLGFKSNKSFTIKGKYAKELLDKLIRYRTNNYNKKELKHIEHSKRISNEYTAIWKD